MRVYNEMFTNRQGELRFPILLIKNPSDALAVFIHSAQKGDLPLVVEYNNEINMISEIGRSKQNFERLLKAFKLRLYIDKSNSYDITDLSQLLNIDNFELLPSLTSEEE